MTLADASTRTAWDQLVALLDELRHVETVERGEEDGLVRPVPLPISLERLSEWAHAADDASGPAFNTISNWLNRRARPGSVKALLAVVEGVRDHRTSRKNLPRVLLDETWIAAHQAMKDERRRDKLTLKQHRLTGSGEAQVGGPPNEDNLVAVAAGAALPSGVRITPDVVDRMIAAVTAQGLDPAHGLHPYTLADTSSKQRVLTARAVRVLLVLLIGMLGGWGAAEMFDGGAGAHALLTSPSSDDPHGLSAAALIPDGSPITDRNVGGWPNRVVGQTIAAQPHTTTHRGQR